MRGLCLSVSPDGAVFQIDGEQPVTGLYYELEDATTGTGAQNRAFHSLLNAFFFWMQRTGNFQFEDGGIVYDLAVPSVGDFREYFKFKYGEGASHYQYVSESFQMVKVKTMDEIPQYAVDDFNAGNKGRVKAVIKSWTDYTLKQRKKAIDQLFMLIFASGCDDKKVHEIMNGMTTNEEKIREVFR
jgi:hypothetical protein